MVSGIDLLTGDNGGKNSGVKLLDQTQEVKPTSGIDLLGPSTVAPTTIVPVEKSSPSLIPEWLSNLISTPAQDVKNLGGPSYKAEKEDLVTPDPVEPKEKSLAISSTPQGLYKEHTQRMSEWLDKSESKNFGIGLGKDAKVSKVIGETLQGLSDLALHPIEATKGIADIFLGLPGFGTGLVDASSQAVKETIDQIVLGPTFNLEEVYFAAAKGMKRSMEFFHPVHEQVLGPISPERDLAAQTAMAPLTGFAMAGQAAANWEGFKDWPNVRGVLRFSGDIGGLLAMGAILHGPSRRKVFVKDVEQVNKKAIEIMEKEKVINETPDQAIRNAQLKVLEIEKAQMELKAQEIAKKFSKDALIREELALQAETIAKEKLRPVRDSGLRGEGTVEFVSKKGNKYVKIDGKWYDGDGKVVKNHFVIKAAEKGVEEGRVKEVEGAKAKPEPPVEQPKTVKKFKPLEKDKDAEPITSVDQATGTSLPNIEGTKSPFFQDVKTTMEFADIYLERVKSITESVEMFTQKLINDVNQWYHGTGEISINQVREALSGLASRAEELRGEFITGQDHMVWRETVSEAATWARRLEREGEVGRSRVTKDIPKVEETQGKKLSDAERIDLINQAWEKAQKEKSKTIKIYHATSPKIASKIRKEGFKTFKISDVVDQAIEMVGWPKERISEIINWLKENYLDPNKPINVDRGIYFTAKKDRVLSEDVVLQEALLNALWGMSNLDKGKLGNKAKSLMDKTESGKKEIIELEVPLKDIKDIAGKPITKKNLGSDIKLSADEANKWLGRQKEKPKTILGTEKSSEGIVLHDLGGAVSEGAKQIIAGARAVSNYTKQARGFKKFSPRESAKLLKEEFGRRFIDRSGNIRRSLLKELDEDGYRVVQKMYLSKGASSLASSRLRQMNKEVYNGLSRHEKNVLDSLILSDRMLDIAKYKTEKQFKYPEGLKPSQTAAYSELFGMIEKLSPERAVEIRKRADAYFEWMKKPLKDMLDAGLITEVEYNNLVSHNYRRLKLVDIFDRKQPVKKKGRTIYDSGVESLSKGRETDIFEPSSEIMALEVFNRAYGRILNNHANKALLDVARSDPQNPFVRVRDDKDTPIPSGWQRFYVFEKGERKSMWLSPEMSKEWIVSSPELSYQMSQLLRYASGSPVLRTFATGINWGFALANLPRDVMHTWFAARTWKDGEWSSVYSPHMPVFGLQIGRDLSTVFLDAALKKNRYQEYINEGGGMEFLVHQGRLIQKGRHIEGPLDSVYNVLGYFGETTEIMTRLAIRDRVIRKRANEQGITVAEARKNKDITQEATFTSRDYMDFGQGGGITKALDNGMPYLNASVQGTRGMFRSFEPGSGTALSSTYKLAQFATLVTGLYVTSKAMHPETMENLEGNVATQNNIVIPLGDKFGFEDSKGQMRYPYLKIPLDPGQKFFKTFFEASTDKWLGNEVDVGRVVDALKDQSPVGVSSLPPTISGILGYATNKDFWMNEDIWKKSDTFSYPESREEYIPGRTPQAYIDLGKATGLSPERSKYAVEELLTNGTVYSYLLGEGYEALFSDLPKDKREKHLAEVLSKVPVVKRFFGLTNPYSKHAEGIDKAEEIVELRRFTENRGLDTLAEGYLYQDNVSRREIFNHISNAKDKDTSDRLRERFKFHEAVKDLPERSFWLRLQGIPVEARAQVFVNRLEKASPEQQEQIWKEYAIIARAKGIISNSFRREVSKLRGQED